MALKPAAVLSMANNYTDETADELGSLKGAPCEIQDIVKKDGVTTITFQWEGKSGAIQTRDAQILDGAEPNEIKSIYIEASNNHLIVKLEDGTLIDAGEMPAEEVAISKESGNAVTKKSDGLYVAATGVKISAKEGNIIKNETDGLYAKADTIEISKKTDNVLKQETDGLYVQKTEVPAISADKDNQIKAGTDKGWFVPKTVVDATYSATSDNAQSGKAVASAISTELGKLTYLSKEIATKAQIDEYVADPTKAKFNVIYLLKDASAKGSDKYFEYQRIGDATTSTFECTGDTSTDLTDYVKKDAIVKTFSATVSDDKVASEKLVKDSLDAKVDDADVITAWEATLSDTKIPSEKLVKESINQKLNISQGTGDAGKFLKVGTDGLIKTSDLPEVKPDGIKKGDITVMETGDKGHVYFKTGVDIGGNGSSPKPLNVHGTLNVDGHSIYCEGIKATDSIWVEDYVKTENLMSATSTYLGNANSNGDISFLCKNVRVVGEKGKEAMQMDSPLALMSAQTTMVNGKEVKQAHLDMGYDGGPGHISTGRLDVMQLQSNGNSGIDVGTPMRFHSHIDCQEINVEKGYAITISDEASHQNMKLTSDGSIFCGDIHCNYPPSSPYGEGTKHSGNNYGEHSIDGVGYFTARNITTYESITYRRGSGKRDWYLGWTAEVGTLTSSALTIKQSIVLHRMLNFMLIKSGNVLCDSQTFVVEQFPSPSGGAVILRTDTNTVINVGISINNSTINVSSLPSGYTVKVVGLS